MYKACHWRQVCGFCPHVSCSAVLVAVAASLLQDCSKSGVAEPSADTRQEKCGYPAPVFTARDLPTEHQHNMPALKNKKVAARWAALSPGGPITQRFLAPHPVGPALVYMDRLSAS